MGNEEEKHHLFETSQTVLNADYFKMLRLLEHGARGV